MASTAPEWVTLFFCPALGVLISNAVGLAPVRAVLEARDKKKLGPSTIRCFPLIFFSALLRFHLLNFSSYVCSDISMQYKCLIPTTFICFKGVLSPIPFALITNSCFGWLYYSVLLADYFIFFSNCFSFLVGIGLCLTAIHILEKSENSGTREDSIRMKVETILFVSACFWVFIILITSIVLRDPKYDEINISIVGAFSVISSLVFYGAPLINMVEIVKSKDASSLYAPALLINGANCTLWFFYGLIGVKAVIVWLPNIIGLALVAVGLVMCGIYPAKRHKTMAFEGEDQPLSDYAVYSDSRHMSRADIFPVDMERMRQMSFSVKSDSDLTAQRKLDSIIEEATNSPLHEV